MRGLTRAVCFVIAMAVLAACESGTRAAGAPQLSPVTQRFVPPDATEQVVASGVPWEQIDFVVRRDPFTFAFDESEIKSAVTDGWLPCRPKSDKWWEYEDRSVTPSRYLQQRTVTLFKNGVLVMLLGRYVSPSQQQAVAAGIAGRERPAQQGVVSARKLSQEEARAIAESFDLTCGA